MFTKRALIFFFILALNTSFCFSQKQTTSQETLPIVVNRGASLLYYVDNSFNSNEFLIPFIESELKNLKDTSHRKLFSSVTSMSFLIGSNNLYNKLITAIRMFNKGNITFKFNKKLSEQDRKVVNELKSRQFFLKININAFNNLLEYQFILLKIIHSPSNKYNFFELENYRANSVFIDPNNKEYAAKIRNSLKLVITEANQPPIPFARFKNAIIRDTIFTTPGNLVLNGDALDEDTPEDQLIYNWEVPGLNGHVSIFAGKDLNIWIRKYGLTPITLKVSDGITTKVRNYLIASRDTPFIQLISDYENEDLNNKKFHVYSFHKIFKANDGSSIFNIRKKFFYGESSAVEAEWPDIIPKLTVASTTNRNNQISFYQLKFGKVEDSLVNYKEVPLEILHQNTTSEFAAKLPAFAVYLQSIGPMFINPESDSKTDDTTQKPNLYRYSMFLNPNYRIKIPTTQYFKVIASDHTIKSSDNFEIQFEKINRLSPYISCSSYSYVVDHQYFDFVFVGVGAEYLLFPAISMDASLGTVTTKSFSSPVYPFYKIDGNVNVIDYKNLFKLRLSIAEIYKKTYSIVVDNVKMFNTIFGEEYRFRLGFGSSIEESFSTSAYQPVTLDFFYMYYPNGFQVTGFNEFGAKIKFTFKSF